MDFGRDGFGCWACGMELVAGSTERRGRLVGSSRLGKKIDKKQERERIKFILF